MGYEYYAVTDHSKKVSMAKGLDEKRPASQIREIDEMNRKMENLRMIDELKKSGVEIRQEESTGSKAPDGKNFVFTGELDEFTRSEAEEKIDFLILI